MGDQLILGIDIGGTGIKGALVDMQTGEVQSDRFRVDTPSPATPEAVLDAIESMIDHFGWRGKPLGCGFPGVVRFDRIETAANLHKSWVGCNLSELIEARTGCRAGVLNDADAAGIAEAKYGAGNNDPGTVLVITLGTGIGSSLIIGGFPVPNTEFGHCRSHKGTIWETYAAASARKRDGLDWPTWGKRVNEFLMDMCRIVSPDLIVIGGGASKKYEKFADQIKVPARVVPATLLNMAGIIGAAMHGQRMAGHEVTTA